MTRLHITRQQKALLTKIVRSVFYEYSNVSVPKKGYLVLRRGMFSKPTFLNLIDFASEFAMRVALKGEQKGLGEYKALKAKILEELYMMVKIYHFNRNYDIVDHLWSIYEKIYNVPNISVEDHPPIPLPESNTAKVHKVVEEITTTSIKITGKLQ
jgi:hypothetical protein